MTPDVTIRLGFYLAEAIALAIPLGCGLLLAQGAANRLRIRAPAVTWRRVFTLGLAVGTIGATLTELVGPQVIVQYQLAALVFVAGAGFWLLSKVVTSLAAKPRAP